jgi:DNA segregation ATPase FtsK/SpoIIIE-like protein
MPMCMHHERPGAPFLKSTETSMTRSYRSSRITLRRPVLALSIAAAFGLAATGAAHAQVAVDVSVSAQEPGWWYDLGAVVSLYIEPPIQQPEPVAIAWAPPPMLVEEVPPPPDPDAVWTGSYWTWQGDWVWCAGRWMDPPRREYVWVQPYYEHRAERVIFIPGYWSAPDAEFIAPPPDRPIAWAYVNEGVVIGPPPEGPVGIFVPPPPGSRPGIIVPALIGTPPAVVVSAPPVMSVGMRISGSFAYDGRHTVTDNRAVNYRPAAIRNVVSVTVQAPAAATASGRAFEAQVPHHAAQAAAMHPQVAARAPVPVSRTAVPAYVPGRTVAALPPPQKVQGLPAVPPHAAANVSQAQRAQMAHAPMTPTEARQARAGGKDVDLQHLPPTAAGPQGAHPAAPAQQPTQRAPQDQAQQRAVQEQAQRADQMRAQQENQQENQQKAQQKAQQEAQQRSQQQAQQRAAQEQAQHAEQMRAQQENQQKAQQEAQQRSQQQAQQRAVQEQAQRASQQRAQQEAQQRSQQRAQPEASQRAEQQQRAQQEAPQRGQPEQAQRAQPQRGEQAHPSQERGERARPNEEGASRPQR